ncbi:MAG: adenylate/guanylate cyclase domain-containing protein [Treponema sp.]|nr:adenylate/guanylate cyclase domain-containing protein [Treponema sp.]
MKVILKNFFVLFLLILNLNQYLFSKENKVKTYEKLDGEWEFYLEKTPEEVINLQKKGGVADCYSNVPGFWDSDIERLLGEKKPCTYGCYRIVKENLDPSLQYAIFIKDSPGTSSALYINGQKIQQNGDPFAILNPASKNKRPSISRPIYAYFPTDSNGRVEIIIFITNYFYRKSGLWDTVFFGQEKSLFKVNQIQVSFNAILVGILVFIGLLNIIHFFINKKKIEYFYLGILSIVCALRISTAGYSLLTFLVEKIPAEIKYKTEYLVLWVVPICLIQILTTLYPIKKKYLGFKWIKEKVIRYSLLAANFLIGMASLILPCYYSNILVPHMQIVLGITSLYIIAMVILNIVRKSPHSIYYLLSCITLLIGGITDLVYTRARDLLPISLFPFFLVVFVFIQIFLLARIQNDIYKETVKISEDLSRLNEAYLRFVPKEFLKLLNKDSITKIQLGDHSNIKMAIIFSKIKIRALDNNLLPEEHFKIFDDFLKNVSPLIKNNNGFVSKFLSGGFMALFPQAEEDSIKSALEILECAKEMNASYQQKEHKIQITPRIGIHYGKMIIGTIGEENRLDDTVISDTVNTASRIESVCEKLDKNLIISDSLKEKVILENIHNLKIFELDAISVKGKEKPLQLYECIKTQGDI